MKTTNVEKELKVLEKEFIAWTKKHPYSIKQLLGILFSDWDPLDEPKEFEKKIANFDFKVEGFSVNQYHMHLIVTTKINRDQPLNVYLNNKGVPVIIYDVRWHNAGLIPITSQYEKECKKDYIRMYEEQLKNEARNKEKFEEQERNRLESLVKQLKSAGYEVTKCES